jgi:type I restriction enzyme S subunit
MSDDLDFDMEVVGDDDLDELGSDDVSSSGDERRLVEAQSGETTAESTDPRKKRVEDNRTGSSSPESDLDDVGSSPSEVDPFRFGDVPADWSVSLVGEIAKGEKGLVDGDWVESKDMDEDGEIQLVQLGHIGEGQFKGQPNRFVNREFAKEEDCTILSEGDLLISRMQEPILRSCLLPDFECDSIMAVDIARLRENDDWNRIFLKYLFNSRPIWKQGIAWASGTTRKRISRKNIEKIRLQKPPLPEQRKIASVLYAVDQAIQKTEAIIEQAKRVKRGLMQDMMRNGLQKHDLEETETRFGTLPRSWEVKRLKELGKIAGRTAPEKEDSQCWGGDIPWATPSEITNLEGNTISKTEEYLTERALEKVSSNLLPPWSVLLTTRATVGACAVNTVPMTTNQGFKSVIPGEDLNTWYAYYRLVYEADQLEARAKGSTFREVGKETVENFEIPVPPREEQQRIGEILKSIDDAILNNKETVSEYERLKKGFLQDLLTGEVRTAGKAIDLLDEVVSHG